MRHVSDILSLSHDIRSMMSTIRHAIADLEATEGRDFSLVLSRMSRAVETCTDFCNQALEKYAHGNAAAPLREVHLAEFLQGLIDEVAPMYGDTIEFKIHCVPTCSEMVCPARLRRIMVNLLKTAADATSALVGPKKVTLFVHRRGGDLKIDVRDNGSGMDERLVRQFAERAGEVVNSGTHLHDVGLPTVFALAEEMGGRLALRHTGPDGSAFRLSIPSTKPMEGAKLTSGF